ncbi:MAG: fumarate reductase/succinate dehydrogenase flavoprotein subunit, partial [Armatimonadetes bacterium]|nr:fumarate reductase/succinate dehydrogenase flavoprotein subunit [Armatimonadota bacterium]
EANFSDHGANRLGASALMQGLADGYFVAPTTVAHYLAGVSQARIPLEHNAFRAATDAVRARLDRLLSGRGSRTPRQFHRQLGAILWDKAGMSRNEQGLTEALAEIPRLRAEFWQDVRVPGEPNYLNQSLEYAGRVADYLEFGELIARDALDRRESCGGHFREESQTPDNEAMRDDANFQHASVWEYQGDGVAPALQKEPLVFENVTPTQRSYA